MRARRSAVAVGISPLADAGTHSDGPHAVRLRGLGFR
jgi:hypothetical protein